jgi:serine/threonine protein kinase
MMDRQHAFELDRGTRFNNYQVESVLGQGGMGVAYLARDVVLGRPVVVKVMLGGDPTEEPRLLERFRREAVAGALIDSEAVVKVFESGRIRGGPTLPIQGFPFIAMQYIDGASLGEIHKARGKLPAETAAAVVLGAARGLVATHAAEIVHRDVKPDNVLLTRTGQVKLVDFGIAKFLKGVGGGPPPPNLTAPGIAVGTPAFVAPEQARGEEVDGRADVYALGVTLYLLMTGELPFLGANANAMVALRLLADPKPPRERVPEIPRELETVCLALLTRESSARPTAADAAALLERIVPGDRSAELAALFGDPGTAGAIDLRASVAERYGLAKEADERPKRIHGNVAPRAAATSEPPAASARWLPAALYAFGSCVLGASAIAVALVLRAPETSAPPAASPPVAQILTRETAPRLLREAIASRSPTSVRATADALRAAPAFEGSAGLLEAAGDSEQLVAAFSARTRAFDPDLPLDSLLDAINEAAAKDPALRDDRVRAGATLLGAVSGRRVPAALLLPSGSSGPGETLARTLVALRLERPGTR